MLSRSGRTMCGALARMGPSGMPSSGRRVAGQPADAEVAGHHPLARDHLEDAQDALALAEAIKKYRHGPDVDRMRTQPDQVAAEAREFGQEHPDPLRFRRDFEVEQLL